MRALYPHADIELVESAGGLFEVTLDGQLLFSKKRTGRHAQPGEVRRLIEAARSG